VRLHEAKLLRLDSSKAASMLGWRPVLNLTSSLEMTVDWYRRYYEDPGSIYSITIKQIERYQHQANGNA